MQQIRRVLIIDDDEDDRELFCEAVGYVSKDIDCFHATDGEKALEFLTRGHGNLPDFIFLDLNMPRLNGKECLAEIKKRNHIKHIPVIIYSTSNSRYDQEETRLLGAANFLHKPNEFKLLIEELTSILAWQ